MKKQYSVSSSSRMTYIGFTSNLERRVREHQRKASLKSHTPKYYEMLLVQTEEYPDPWTAIGREKELNVGISHGNMRWSKPEIRIGWTSARSGKRHALLGRKRFLWSLRSRRNDIKGAARQSATVSYGFRTVLRAKTRCQSGNYRHGR